MTLMCPTNIFVYSGPACCCCCRAFNDSRNDFLFERNLNGFVAGIVREFSSSKPALVFCRYRPHGRLPVAAVVLVVAVVAVAAALVQVVAVAASWH